MVGGSGAARSPYQPSARRLAGNQPIHSFPYTVERKDRTVYFSALRNGEQENFFGAVVGSEPIVESLQVSHLDPAPSGTTLLEVALQGVTQGSHRVQVTLNGVSVGEVNFQNQYAGVNSFPLAPSWLRKGTNQVELTALVATGHQPDRYHPPDLLAHLYRRQ